MKDPFQVAIEEEATPPPSTGLEDDDDYDGHIVDHNDHSSNTSAFKPTVTHVPKSPNKDHDDEEDMEVDTSKLPPTSDPNKMAQMQAILSQFSEEQMSRYESFRRSGFQKASMKKLLVSVTGNQKVTLPMTITVCGIAKLFVGELVETGKCRFKYIVKMHFQGRHKRSYCNALFATHHRASFTDIRTARMVMTERKECGPIRPCHIREAFRRLKLEGKVPRRSVPRLFKK